MSKKYFAGEISRFFRNFLKIFIHRFAPAPTLCFAKRNSGVHIYTDFFVIPVKTGIQKRATSNEYIPQWRKAAKDK
jgi:hypothetical protein